MKRPFENIVSSFPINNGLKGICEEKKEMEELQAHIDLAFDHAEKGISKITEELMTMDGMSGVKTRHFYNNLLNRADSRYLEIGTWKGSSVCSAMCGNQASVVCIDNWSQFGGPKEEFLVNFKKYKGENYAMFIEKDCYQVDAECLPRFNIYMYDGEHSWDNHYNALCHYYRCMDDTFIFIVDDWNWSHIRDATMSSFRALNVDVLYHREIRTTNDNSDAVQGSPEQKAWHNGIYVAILRKRI
jgi:hypothetical protein